MIEKSDLFALNRFIRRASSSHFSSMFFYVSLQKDFNTADLCNGIFYVMDALIE